MSLKQNDTGTEIRVTVKDQDGAIVPLDTATSATLKIDASGTTKELVCEFVTPRSGGVVRYYSASTDLAVSGSVKAELKVVFADGKVFRSKIITDTIERVL